MSDDSPCPYCERAWRMRADRARRRMSWLQPRRRVPNWRRLTDEARAWLQACPRGKQVDPTAMSDEELRSFLRAAKALRKLVPVVP